MKRMNVDDGWSMGPWTKVRWKINGWGTVYNYADDAAEKQGQSKCGKTEKSDNTNVIREFTR